MEKIESLENMVNNLEQSYIATPNDLHWENLNKAKLELKEANNSHLDLLNQKYREDWIRFGDSNSKMFHAILKCRNQYNHFHSFTDQNGDMPNLDKLQGEAIDYFKKLFHSQGTEEKPKLLDNIPRRISTSEMRLFANPLLKRKFLQTYRQ
jgi:hypothetical protein